MERIFSRFRKLVLIMDNEALRKEALSKYLNSTSNDLLIDFIKEIATNHIDAIYSREILEVIMNIDASFKDEINRIDEEEILPDYIYYKKALTRYKYIDAYEYYDYEEDDDLPICCNSKTVNVLNNCYLFILKLMKLHRYKEANDLVIRMKTIDVAIYGEGYEEDDEDYDEEEIEEDEEELVKGNFINKLDILNFSFKEKDIQAIELKLAYVSKDSALAIAKPLLEYGYYDTDLSFLIHDFKLNTKQINNLLVQIEKELIHLDKTKLINLFIPLGKLKIDLSTFFSSSYELIHKNKDIYYAFLGAASETILKYAPLFLDEQDDSYYELARIIFESALKEDDEKLILKYALILYFMKPDIYLLIYIFTLNKNSNEKRKLALYSDKIKPTYVSIIIGEIKESTMEEFEKELPLGWKLTPNDELLTLLQYLVASKSKNAFKQRLLDKFVNERIDDHSVLNKYFLRYLDIIDKVQVDKNRVVKTIEILSLKRIEGIVFNKYRYSYYKAARLLKDLMMLQSDNLDLSTDYYQYMNRFAHYTAFIKEFKEL